MAGHHYSNKLRVRVNGLLVENNALLLVRLRHPTREETIWMPPGGGVEFGESLEVSLQREVLEETGIHVKVGSLRYIHEFIEPPLHALEFYFDCVKVSGNAVLGNDPEHPDDDQLLQDLRFVPLQDLDSLPVIPVYIQKNFAREYTAQEPANPKMIRS